MNVYNSRSEGLDGVHLPLLHLSCVAPAHDGDGLAGVDLIRSNTVAIEVADALDGIGLAVEFNLVRLHHLLDGLPDVAEAHVYARCGYAGLGGGLHSPEEGIIPGIERHGPRRVDDPAVNLRSEVNLHHVIVLEDSVVPRVGRIMRRDVVNAAPRGEADAPEKAILLHQFPILVL